MPWCFTVGYGESGIANELPWAVSSAAAPPHADGGVRAKFCLAGFIAVSCLYRANVVNQPMEGAKRCSVAGFGE